MFIKDFNKCQEIIAGDNTILREILSPYKDGINIRYSIAHAKVKPGETTFAHKLKSSEVYFILQGEGIMRIDDEKEQVFTGYAIYISPNSTQQITNTGQDELIFLCIVDPPWKAEDEEVLE